MVCWACFPLTSLPAEDRGIHSAELEVDLPVLATA
jgi:hypothetical protein